MENSKVSFFSDKKGYFMPDGSWSWHVNASDAYNLSPGEPAIRMRSVLRPIAGNVNIVWANNAIAYYESDGWSEWTHNLS